MADLSLPRRAPADLNLRIKDAAYKWTHEHPQRTDHWVPALPTDLHTATDFIGSSKDSEDNEH